MRLMEGNQFDTIYHEHFSYFSFLTAGAGLRGARPDACSTSRRSPRTAARCGSTRDMPRSFAGRSSAAVGELRSREERAGFTRLETYRAFDEQVKETKRKLLEFLDRRQAPGQVGRRLRRARQRQYALNYCGIRTDFIDYTVDRNPYKHYKFLPGTPHPDLSARADPADPPRLRADSAVEPEGRNHGAALLYPRMGRPVRRADPRGPGVHDRDGSAARSRRRQERKGAAR